MNMLHSMRVWHGRSDMRSKSSKNSRQLEHAAGDANADLDATQLHRLHR